MYNFRVLGSMKGRPPKIWNSIYEEEMDLSSVYKGSTHLNCEMIFTYQIGKKLERLILEVAKA